jgi:hypothetical protein
VLDGPDGVVDVPGSHDFSTIGDALAPSNLADALTVSLIPVIFALFMTDFFDTIGTAVAVGRAGGLLDDKGELPKTRELLLVDSSAASLGGAMGCSSVTTYVESGAGVAEGARTGLSALVTAALFALALLFVPVMALVGQGVDVSKTLTIHPAVAPALVMVGYLMMRTQPATTEPKVTGSNPVGRALSRPRPEPGLCRSTLSCCTAARNRSSVRGGWPCGQNAQPKSESHQRCDQRHEARGGGGTGFDCGAGAVPRRRPTGPVASSLSACRQGV